MAFDNAALLKVLEAMEAAGVEDGVRTPAQTIYQELIDAELTAVIAPALTRSRKAAPDPWPESHRCRTWIPPGHDQHAQDARFNQRPGRPRGKRNQAGAARRSRPRQAARSRPGGRRPSLVSGAGRRKHRSHAAERRR